MKKILCILIVLAGLLALRAGVLIEKIAYSDGTTVSTGAATYYACILNNTAAQSLTTDVAANVTMTNSVLNIGTPYCTNNTSSSTIGIVSSGYYTVRGFTYMTGTSLTKGFLDICTNSTVPVAVFFSAATDGGFTPSGSKTVYLVAGSAVGMLATEYGTDPQLYNTQDKLKTFLEVEYKHQ